MSGPTLVRTPSVGPSPGIAVQKLRLGRGPRRLDGLLAFPIQLEARFPSQSGGLERVVGRLLGVPDRPDHSPPHDRAPLAVAEHGPRWRVWCGRRVKLRCGRLKCRRDLGTGTSSLWPAGHFIADREGCPVAAMPGDDG